MNTGEINSTNIESYDPTKIKVVVGLSNKIDSFVAAYLLKKQKYNVIGITVLTWNNSSEDDEEEEQATYDFGNDDKEKEEVKFNAPKCSIIDTKQIEKFCQWLDIPFYVADASASFERCIVDPAVEKRLEGRYFQSCINCHSFRVNTLYEKALKLGAHLIATGHYAKIHLHKSYNQHFIYKANDIKNDQSFILSGLNEEISNKLLLPLGDLLKEEVLKLSEVYLKAAFDDNEFLIESKKNIISKNEFGHCLSHDPNMISYINQNVTDEFWQPVSLINVSTELYEGDFAGKFCLQYGALKSNFTDDSISDKNRILGFSGDKAFSGVPKEFETDYFEVYKLHLANNISRLKPFSCFIKKESHEMISATMYFKSSDRAFIEVEEKNCFHPDEKIAIYDSDKKMGKIVANCYVVDRIKEFYVDKLSAFREEALDINDKEIYEGF